MRQLFFFLIFMSMFPSSIYAKETKQCVVIYSIDFSSGEMSEIKYDYRFCEANGGHCEKWHSVKLKSKSAFRLNRQCRNTEKSKIVQIRYDGSFEEGFQENIYRLKTSIFRMSDWRRFRLPSDDCIQDGSHYFSIKGERLKLYQGKPNVRKEKCKWTEMSNIHYQKCITSKLTISDRLANCDKSIQLNPKNAAAYINRGNTWDNKGEYDKAIADYNEALRLDPKSVLAYSNRGNTWDNKGEYDKAIADFNEALRLDPKSVLAYSNRGYTWDNKGEYDKAIADYNEALRLDPKSVNLYINRGFVWSKKGEYDKAIADYNEALRLDPKSVRAYSNRGFVWSKKGEYDKAIADFNEALRLDPKDAATYLGLGNIFIEKEMYKDAIANFVKGIRLEPKAAYIYHSLGAGLFHGGLFQKAEKAWKKACKLAKPAKIQKWKTKLTDLGHFSSKIDTICTDELINAFKSCAKEKCDF